MLYPSHVPMHDLEYPEKENSQPLQRLNQAKFSEQGEERLGRKARGFLLCACFRRAASGSHDLLRLRKGCADCTEHPTTRASNN